MFRQKDPKPLAPGRGPQEKPKVVILNAVKNLFFVGSRSLIESSFATLRTGAALRQSSPPYEMDGTGAQPRPQAPRQLQKAKTLDPHACPACPERSRRKRSRRKHSRGCARMTTPAVMPGLIGHPVSLGFPPLFGKARDDTLRLRSGQAAGRPLQNRGACVPGPVFLVSFAATNETQQRQRHWMPDY